MSTQPDTVGRQDTRAGALDIDTTWSSRQAFLETVDALLEAAHAASSDYANSSAVLSINDQLTSEAGPSLAWSLDLDLKDLCVLAAIVQAPLALRGATDRGKTYLASQVLSGLFGPQGKGWARCEVNRGLSVDDLIDVDVQKLSEARLSEAISSATWISRPAVLLDETNRAHAKLTNILLHVVDGTGLNVRGDLFIPVGMPYTVGGNRKRYSACILTANVPGGDMAGTFEEDAALTRRVVLSYNLDQLPVTTRDVAQLTDAGGKRARPECPQASSQVETVVRVYESLPQMVPVLALARLMLHYFWGMGSCVRTRTGRLRRDLVPGICAKCHLSKAHPFCGRVAGLSEGLLVWVRELATGIAAIRAAKVLRAAREDCLSGRGKSIQDCLGTRQQGQELYTQFAGHYAEKLAVRGEDMVAAYRLVAPEHLWISPKLVDGDPSYEKCASYAFADIAGRSWRSMLALLREHERLFAELAENRAVSFVHQDEIESLVTTKDAAMLSVIAAFRDIDLNMRIRDVPCLNTAA